MTTLLSALASAPWFQNFITLTIVFAGVLVGIETSPEMVQAHGETLHLLDQLVLGIFIFEIAVKLGAEGRRPWRYFRDGWNVFDFLIVASSLLPLGGQQLMVLRLVRLLRVLRLVRTLPKLQILVTALIKSFPSMGYVSLLLGLVFYVFGVAGTFLFSQNDPVHFGSLSTSLLSLFRIVTLEGWTELLYIQMRGCDASGYSDFPQLCTAPQAQPAAAVVFFVVFILLGTMVVLNLFIGVIMNGMTEATEESERDRGPTPHSAAGELQLLEVKLAELQLQVARVRGQLIGETSAAAQRKAG
jgi:voltage-gated sodium channel